MLIQKNYILKAQRITTVEIDEIKENIRLKIGDDTKLPKLKTNSKLIKLQEEINGVTEELLEEDEMNITDINNLIYAAATIMTQTLNEPSKRSKNRRNVKFWKIRMQK